MRKIQPHEDLRQENSRQKEQEVWQSEQMSIKTMRSLFREKGKTKSVAGAIMTEGELDRKLS